MAAFIFVIFIKSFLQIYYVKFYGRFSVDFTLTSNGLRLTRSICRIGIFMKRIRKMINDGTGRRIQPFFRLSFAKIMNRHFIKLPWRIQTCEQWFFLIAIFLFIVISFPLNHVNAAGRTVRVGVYQNKPKVFLDEQGKADGFFHRFIGRNFSTRRLDLNLPTMRMGGLSGRTRNSVNQLDGLTVAVLKGSVQLAALELAEQDHSMDVEIVTATSLEEVFQLVEINSADVAMVNKFFGDYHYKEYGLSRTPVILGIQVLYYATIQGKNQDLLDSIDKYLGVWRDDPDSVYTSLLASWLDRSKDRQRLKYFGWFVDGLGVILCFT